MEVGACRGYVSLLQTKSFCGYVRGEANDVTSKATFSVAWGVFVTLENSRVEERRFFSDLLARFRPPKWAGPGLTAVFVLVLGFGLTFAAWTSASRADARAGVDRFAFLTARLHDAIAEHRQVHAKELFASAALVQTVGSVSAAQWRSMYEFLRVGERHAGVQGLGFVEVVQGADRADHEERIRAQGYPDYAVKPPGERETYASIAYLEPEPVRIRVHGFDMLTDPVRREAMERARDTGKVATSGRVTLFHDKNLAPGFLLYVPVYGAMGPAPDVAERRQALRGFVFSPVRTADFFGGIADNFSSDLGPNLAIEVFDGANVNPDSRIFECKIAEVQPGALSHVIPYNLFDRPWTVRLTALPAFETQRDQRTRLTIAVSGGAITLMMAALAASASRRSREQQEIARHKDMVARELSHRVKNLLSVIQSMAMRSLSEGRTLSEAKQVLTDRISALARVHSGLVDSQWSGAMLHDLVNGELAPFGARIVALGPAVQVNAQMAQHLAMALHELATNAVKYGALSSPTGSVRVEWRVFMCEQEQRFRFCWRESGGPPAIEPKREGFGQKLLRRLLGTALSAQPTIEYTPEGLRYRFECELSRIGTIPSFKRI